MYIVAAIFVYEGSASCFQYYIMIVLMPPLPPNNANLHGCYPTDSMASHIFDCLCPTENLKRLLAMSCREVPQVQHMLDANVVQHLQFT